MAGRMDCCYPREKFDEKGRRAFSEQDPRTKAVACARFYGAIERVPTFIDGVNPFLPPNPLICICVRKPVVPSLHSSLYLPGFPCTLLSKEDPKDYGTVIRSLQLIFVSRLYITFDGNFSRVCESNCTYLFTFFFFDSILSNEEFLLNYFPFINLYERTKLHSHEDF